MLHRDILAYRDKTGAEAGAEARAEAEAGILANRGMAQNDLISPFQIDESGKCFL